MADGDTRTWYRVYTHMLRWDMYRTLQLCVRALALDLRHSGHRVSAEAYQQSLPRDSRDPCLPVFQLNIKAAGGPLWDADKEVEAAVRSVMHAWHHYVDLAAESYAVSGSLFALRGQAQTWELDKLAAMKPFLTMLCCRSGYKALLRCAHGAYCDAQGPCAIEGGTARTGAVLSAPHAMVYSISVEKAVACSGLKTGRVALGCPACKVEPSATPLAFIVWSVTVPEGTTVASHNSLHFQAASLVLGGQLKDSVVDAELAGGAKPHPPVTPCRVTKTPALDSLTETTSSLLSGNASLSGMCRALSLVQFTACEPSDAEAYAILALCAALGKGGGHTITCQDWTKCLKAVAGVLGALLEWKSKDVLLSGLYLQAKKHWARAWDAAHAALAASSSTGH